MQTQTLKIKQISQQAQGKNNKIQLENCQILAHYEFADGQKILTIASDKIPQLVKPGQFVHISLDNSLEMRRPISVMSVDLANQTFDLLYKIVGNGTKLLANKQIGEYLSVLGPIGNGFKMTSKKLPLLIGGGVGMPPMIAIAQEIKDNDYYDPFVVLASESLFPFTLTTSKIGSKCKANKISATMPLLEEWGVATRLASLSGGKRGFEGVFNGYATDLARKYLETLTKKELKEVEIYSCGPHPMLEAVKKLATEFNLPSQLSLEEFMACAVGGCAGCVVKTVEDNKEYMRRVCVDGPVFAGEVVFNT